MYREFEGKTEQEAVALAIAELQIDRQDFDVEIVDTGRKGLFKKGPVKIRVHLDDEKFEEVFEEVVSDDESVAKHVISEEFEQEVIDFVTTLLVKMGFPGSVEVVSRKEGKLGLDIVSSHSAIIIGRKGKNLDAIQLLANVYAGKLDEEVKVVIDGENYRMRHEEQLVRMAFRQPNRCSSGKSRLLEPMNPREALIHTALFRVHGVQTKSEGTACTSKYGSSG